MMTKKRRKKRKRRKRVKMKKSLKKRARATTRIRIRLNRNRLLIRKDGRSCSQSEPSLKKCSESNMSSIRRKGKGP